MTGLFPLAILAGGMATRLRPLTHSIPKSLIEVNREPFLSHQLKLLRAAGIDRVVLCVGHLGNLIEEFAGDGSRFGLQIEYSNDGPVPLGTAGAIRRALPLLGENFFCLYGDSYLPCDFGAVQRAFEQSGKSGLMTVYRNEGQWDRSNVEIADGQVRAHDKRLRTPAMRHIDYGLGVFRAGVFEHLPEGRPSDLGDVYRDLLSRGDLASFEVHDRFYEVGSFDGIRELEQFLSATKGAVA